MTSHDPSRFKKIKLWRRKKGEPLSPSLLESEPAPVAYGPVVAVSQVGNKELGQRDVTGRAAKTRADNLFQVEEQLLQRRRTDGLYHSN